MLCSSKISYYSLILMLGSIQFGFTLNFGGLPIEGLKKKYPNWDFNKDEQKISFFLNFASLFGSIGGFIVRILFHYANPKKIICFFNIVNAILWLFYFLFSPKNFEVGIILRSLQGVITGGFACITPILMTNMSPDETVGMIGCINQFGVVLGMIIFSVIGSFADFRALIITASIVDVLQAGSIWIIPNNKFEKDKKDKIFQIKNARNIFIAIMLMVFQQFCGINAILDNLTNIMSNTGVYIDQNLQAALSSSSQLVSVFIASFNIDGIGRRKMWVFSSCGIIISQILYIISIKVVNIGWFQATSVFVYLLSFGHGFGPIPWFIAHDLFPRYLRLDVQTLITFANMICSFGVTYLFPVMKKKFDEYIIMIIFLCITVISLPFGIYFIPNNGKIGDEILTII